MKSPPTAVSLLLTNLQLLDYDNDPEQSFPINSDVFTSLKNKGKAFEHIAYHLFHILDPEECALVCGFHPTAWSKINKEIMLITDQYQRLDTCWPIFEPAQSRELRNVIFKWLSDLKKNGQLGGNVLVRRTLLDDCSGDRYEELLLALSTYVLRSQLEKGNIQNAICKTFGAFGKK